MLRTLLKLSSTVKCLFPVLRLPSEHSAVIVVLPCIKTAIRRGGGRLREATTMLNLISRPFKTLFCVHSVFVVFYCHIKSVLLERSHKAQFTITCSILHSCLMTELIPETITSSKWEILLNLQRKAHEINSALRTGKLLSV